MITDALLAILFGFLSLVLSFFQGQANVPPQNGITDAIAYAATLYSAANIIFPFGTLFAIIIAELVFEGIYFVYKLIRWAYRKVPGIS